MTEQTPQLRPPYTRADLGKVVPSQEEGARLLDRAQKMGSQLGNWVMVANAGGLAFVLTTARENITAADLHLGGAYTVFLVGLIAGFAGHLFLVLSFTAGAAYTMARESAEEGIERRGVLTYELAQRGLQRPKEYDEYDKKDRATLDRNLRNTPSVAMAALGFLAYAVAAISAVIGLVQPLASGLLG